MNELNVGPKLTDGCLQDNYRSFDERQQELRAINTSEADNARRRRNSPFSDFYQTNRGHSKELLWLAINQPKAHGILILLLEHMDEYNALMCSYQVLQDALNVSYKTISRGIAVLKEKGFIAIFKSGTSNVYVVNNRLAWSSWGTNVPYCKFPANIILSAAENKEQYEKSKIKQLSLINEAERTQVNE